MISAAQKKAIHLSIIIILLFIGAGMVFYFFIIYFPGSLKPYKNDAHLTALNFTGELYPRLLGIEQVFLVVLAAIFAASIWISRKIIHFTTTSWWSGFLLILCWVLLLISIVCDGLGLLYLNNWSNSEWAGKVQHNLQIFKLSVTCFCAAGISVGLALTSMLTAFIVLFIQQINFSDAGDWVPDYINIPEL